MTEVLIKRTNNELQDLPLEIAIIVISALAIYSTCKFLIKRQVNSNSQGESMMGDSTYSPNEIPLEPMTFHRNSRVSMSSTESLSNNIADINNRVNPEQPINDSVTNLTNKPLSTNGEPQKPNLDVDIELGDERFLSILEDVTNLF